MTISAQEGSLIIPAPGTLKVKPEDLGFRTLPAGEMNISDIFYPDPTNNPSGTALFNIFIHSVDFTGEVYLICRPPSSSIPGVNHWHQPISRAGAGVKPLNWSLKPTEAVRDTCEEPENGVGFALAIFGTPPGEIHYRMSL